MRSISAAYEEAMKKKSSKGKGLVHPSFPPQGAPQPSYMGSQSMPPVAGDPSDYSTAMPPPPGAESIGAQNAY